MPYDDNLESQSLYESFKMLNTFTESFPASDHGHDGDLYIGSGRDVSLCQGRGGEFFLQRCDLDAIWEI